MYYPTYLSLYLYLKAIQNYRLIQFHKIFYYFTRQVKTCSRRSRTPIKPLTCKRNFQDMSTYVYLNFWTSYNLCANAHISMSETVSSPRIKTTVGNNWPDTNIPFSIYEMISEKWQRQKIIIQPDIIVFGAIYPPFWYLYFSIFGMNFLLYEIINSSIMVSIYILIFLNIVLWIIILRI